MVEHPFGTLKCRAGYQHFLVRGFDKVRGEWSLMALCYNFTRVLNILGLDGFLAYLASKAKAVRSLLTLPALVPCSIPLAAEGCYAILAILLEVAPRRAIPAP